MLSTSRTKRLPSRATAGTLHLSSGVLLKLTWLDARKTIKIRTRMWSSYGSLWKASWSPNLIGKTRHKKEPLQSSLTWKKNLQHDKLLRTLSKSMKEAISPSPNCKLSQSFHPFQKWTEPLKRTTESTIASLMDSYFVQCLLRTLVPTTQLATLWRGRMEKSCQNLRIMGLYTYTIWIATFKDRNSISLARKQMTYR